MTRHLSLIALLATVLVGSSAFAQAGLVDRPDGSKEFSLGKRNSVASWRDADIELLNIAGEETAAGALKPWEFTPDQRLMKRLHERYEVNRWFRPREDPQGKFKLWMDGQPRFMRGGGNNQFPSEFQPVQKFLDGDLVPHYSRDNYGPGGNKTGSEFYTFGFGTQMPVEQYRITYPPTQNEDGTPHADCCDPEGLPWNVYVPRQGELSGSQFETEEMTGIESSVFYQSNNYHRLTTLLGETENVFRGPLVINFPRQFLEFVRWRSIPDQYGFLIDGNAFYGEDPQVTVFQFLAGYGEFEVYGRGFPKEVKYLSQVIDLEKPHTLGRIFMDVSQWRREGAEWEKTPVPTNIEEPGESWTWSQTPTVTQISEGEIVPAPDADLEVSIRIKNGSSSDTRAYTTVNELGEVIAITADEWNALNVSGTLRFGIQGPVGENTNDWGSWSGSQIWDEKMRDDGVFLELPSKQHFQFEIRLKTEDMDAYAQIDSLWIEFFPQLADKLVGEVGLPGDLESRLAEVTIGDTTEFRYAILAELDAGSTGFDALRIDTPGKPEFLYLWKEDPTKDASLSLEERTRDITPSEIMEEANGLTLRLPANEAVRTGSEKIWVGFEAPIFNVIAQMSSAVFDWDETQASQENQLSQQVEEGNADDDIPTNQLRVIASGSAINDVITDLRFNTQSITPNGDTMNDELEISYTLFGVLNTEVEVTIYTLGGTPVFRKLATGQVAGFNPPITWNGTDDAGQLVQPGVYLVQVAAKTGVGSFEITRPIAMAY